MRLLRRKKLLFYCPLLILIGTGFVVYRRTIRSNAPLLHEASSFPLLPTRSSIDVMPKLVKDVKDETLVGRRRSDIDPIVPVMKARGSVLKPINSKQTRSFTGLATRSLVKVNNTNLVDHWNSKLQKHDILRRTTKAALHSGVASGIVLSPEYKFIQNLNEFNVTSSRSNAVDADVPYAFEQDVKAELAFYHAVELLHVTCDDIRRLGNEEDGGWNLCFTPPYTLHAGSCIVYSFGINNDFSFDDAASRDFGCKVFAFDPSMSVDDYVRPSGVQFFQLGLGKENTVSRSGWKMMTLYGIRRRLNHLNAVIDVLKIDIDYAEWQSLPEMISADSLRDVRQLVLEIHTPEVYSRSTDARHFRRMWSTLAGIESFGFRRYWVHPNPAGLYTSSRTGLSKTCCYDLGYVNVRYLA